jgi:hypothetical protein
MAAIVDAQMEIFLSSQEIFMDSADLGKIKSISSTQIHFINSIF